MKQTLRKQYLTIRSQIEDKETKSQIIINKILTSDDYQQAHTIALYYALEDEVHTIPLIQQALLDQKRVCLPKVISKNEMVFYEIHSFNDVASGHFNIYEPTTSFIVDSEQIDFMIVPGICFDKQHYRIGFGKGYYDRYLKDTTIHTIGICYQEQLVDSIPIDEHDVALDDVITDKTC